MHSLLSSPFLAALLYLRGGISTRLSGAAALPACFSTLSNVTKMEFAWQNTDATKLPDAPASVVPTPLILDPQTQSSRSLRFRASTMLVGLRYLLRLQGCMVAAPEICGTAFVDVARTPEPLSAVIAGGSQRTVGLADPFTLNACDSADPDDPLAR